MEEASKDNGGQIDLDDVQMARDECVRFGM